MINQQLLDYIKQQLQQNASREQIKNSLLASGWQVQDIEEGFNAVNFSVAAEQKLNFPDKKFMKMGKIIAISFIGIAVIGSGIYFVSQNFFELEKSFNELIDQIWTEDQPASSSPVSGLPVEQTPKINTTGNCDIFSDKLSSCTKYKCQFVNLLIKETIEKEISGIINGKCNYTEQITNNGKMECKFTESARKAVAEYYKNAIQLESMGIIIDEELGSSDKQKIAYIMDGKVVENPLQEAINNGMCAISSY